MSVREKVLDLVFPPKCPFCQKILEDPRAPVCPVCQPGLPWLEGAAGERRVSVVAARVGVHVVNYFSRLFKMVVGMTPGEYRLKAQK